MVEKVKITGTTRGYGVNADVDLVVELSLRDLFAAFAVTGLIAQSDRKTPTKTFAEEAYHCADAMMAQREEQPR